MDDCPDKNMDNKQDDICHESDLIPQPPTLLEKLRNKLDGTSVKIKHNVYNKQNRLKYVQGWSKRSLGRRVQPTVHIFYKCSSSAMVGKIQKYTNTVTINILKITRYDEVAVFDKDKIDSFTYV